MGYRRLLQSYLAHVEQLLGSSLVELSPASSLFSKRDLGELHALAAEAERKALHDELEPAKAANSQPDFGALLAAAIRSYGLTEQQAATIAGVDTGCINRWCYTAPNSRPEGHISPFVAPLNSEEFTRVLIALLAWQRQQQNSHNPTGFAPSPTSS